MRVVTAVLAVLAVGAVAWLLVEARALRAPPPASPPGSVTPSLAAAPPPNPPPPSTATTPPPSAPKRGRTLALAGQTTRPPAEPAQPPPPTAAPTPAETAAARARVESLLGAITRVCPLPGGADRTQHLVFRVTTGRDRVQSLEHGQGALPDAVTACVDRRLYAARWPAIAAPLTLELDVRAADLLQ